MGIIVRDDDLQSFATTCLILNLLIKHKPGGERGARFVYRETFSNFAPNCGKKVLIEYLL